MRVFPAQTGTVRFQQEDVYTAKKIFGIESIVVSQMLGLQVMTFLLFQTDIFIPRPYYSLTHMACREQIPLDKFRAMVITNL